jgi:hypothetical protein
MGGLLRWALTSLLATSWLRIVPDVSDASIDVEVNQVSIVRRNEINTEGIMMRLHGDGQSLGDEALLLNSPHRKILC